MSHKKNTPPEEQRSTRQISFNVDNFTANEIEHRVDNDYLNRNALFNDALRDYMRICAELDVQLGELKHWSDDHEILNSKRYTIHLTAELADIFNSFESRVQGNQDFNKSRIVRIAVADRIFNLMNEEGLNDW